MERFEVRTHDHSEFQNITAQVESLVVRSGVKTGLAHVYVPHTTAGLTINENADPQVVSDILGTLEKLVPWRQAHFQHDEGNSAAHIKASLLGFSTSIPIENGHLALGTWQGLYLCEFDGPRTRQVWVNVVRFEA